MLYLFIFTRSLQCVFAEIRVKDIGMAKPSRYGALCTLASSVSSPGTPQLQVGFIIVIMMILTS